MKFTLSIIILSSIFAIGCGTAPSNVANSNSNGPVKLDPANMPAGINTSPVQPSGNSTPGIPPANAVNAVPKGATPTPGIPDPADLNKKPKPGATPTPGIPDQETLKKQLQRPANVSATPPAGEAPSMMRSTNTNGPRTVRKPQ